VPLDHRVDVVATLFSLGLHIPLPLVVEQLEFLDVLFFYFISLSVGERAYFLSMGCLEVLEDIAMGFFFEKTHLGESWLSSFIILLTFKMETTLI